MPPPPTSVLSFNTKWSNIVELIPKKQLFFIKVLPAILTLGAKKQLFSISLWWPTAEPYLMTLLFPILQYGWIITPSSIKLFSPFISPKIIALEEI